MHVTQAEYVIVEVSVALVNNSRWQSNHYNLLTNMFSHKNP